MGNIFAASEVVELGIQIEKNGRDFYNALAKKTKNEAAGKVFIFLAGEEEKHIKAFEGILEKARKYEPQGLDADDYFAYMNALASEHVFTQKNQGEKEALACKNDKEAIQKGIGFEEDSIVFYEGIKKLVPDYEAGVVDELIAQEQKHLRQLIGLKNEVK